MAGSGVAAFRSNHRLGLNDKLVRKDSTNGGETR